MEGEGHVLHAPPSIYAYVRPSPAFDGWCAANLERFASFTLAGRRETTAVCLDAAVFPLSVSPRQRKPRLRQSRLLRLANEGRSGRSDSQASPPGVSALTNGLHKNDGAAERGD